jgi:hypothetical protein
MSIQDLSKKLVVAGVKHIVIAANAHDNKLSNLLESYALPIVENEFKPLEAFLESAWVGKDSNSFEIGIVVSGKYNFTIDIVYRVDDVYVSVSGKGKNINNISGSWTEKNSFDSIKSVLALNGKEFKSFLKEVLAKVKHRCLSDLSATAAFTKKPAAQTPEGWDAALEYFLTHVEELIEKYNRASEYKHAYGTKVISEDAQKYTKVYVVKPQSSKSIYCFIDRSNGDILKPATHSVPAKGSRGNIFDENHGMKRMGPYGPEYNK